MSTISKQEKDRLSRDFTKKVMKLVFEQFDIKSLWKCPHCGDIMIDTIGFDKGITHHCGNCFKPVFRVVD